MAGVVATSTGASPGTETVTPASPPSQPSYLKSYPYLFVRETDQTDYFCTVCEESLKEDQLQSHLFEGHSAENLQDYFVRVCPEGQGKTWFGPKKYLYICVVCWAKMNNIQDMHGHRESCKVNFGEDSNDNTMDDTEPLSVVSTPDIPTMILEDNENETIENTNGHSKMNGNYRSSTPPFPHPEVIIDTEPPQHVIQLPKYPETSTSKQEPVYSSQCMQCSLCTMILPSSSYLSHLRTYHRVTCPLNNANCPLCMTCVPIMDLTVHLASQHGLVPQSAVNALLLWVLTSNTFALNETAQASLKAKFKGQQANSGHSSPKIKAMPVPTSTPSQSQNSKPRTIPFPTMTSSPIVKPGTPTPGAIAQGAVPKQDSEPTLLNDLRGKVPIEQIISKFTRSHVGPGGKQSHQCLVCSKWYAVPPIKHMRSHIFTFSKEKRKVLQLANGVNICLICYRGFDSQQGVAGHVSTHTPEGLPGGASSVPIGGGLLAEALLGFPPYAKQEQTQDNSDDLPLGATFETPGLKPNSPSPSLVSTATTETVNVELDNAGRVKSGKVRKQCELCGEWSNIKWFFKHMSEVHQALFCRCCREYLPIHEHKEHRQWHSMPPYMGQKIRIEEGQPIIIDRKERASLTPIGSLAAWGGSSGGLVVKAVDEISRKRKAERIASPNGSVKTSGSSSIGDNGGYQLGMLPPELPGRDSLMPKERCPVCSIEITHKNLARHIKLRHGIRYKFCYKCRKLVPGQLYPEHKALHDAGQLESVPVGVGDKHLEFVEGIKTDEDEDDAIEIPEEMLDQALDGNNANRKDDSFRANTSMTKLESLMGKEFKHPRRKCQICGYSVSYSNFKRHLRNAHPGELTDEQVNQEGGEEMMGHHMDDSDRLNYNAISGIDEKNEIVEGYSECKKCGDHVMKEFMPRHMRMTHGEEMPPVKGTSPRPRNIIMRACPECGVEMRSDSITKHCKIKHKVSYRYCSACSKYVMKKYFKSHLRKHENGELTGEVSQDDEDIEDGDLDTSKDDEDEKDIDDEDSMDVQESNPSPKAPNKIYNCVDCTRMFMSAEAHANHLRDVHGGEGGSVVLKLPGDKMAEKKADKDENKDDNDENADDDELVIDDSQ